MHEEVVKALNEPTFKGKLEAQGFSIVASRPQQTGEFVASEITRWGKVIKTGNIKAD